MPLYFLLVNMQMCKLRHNELHELHPLSTYDLHLSQTESMKLCQLKVLHQASSHVTLTSHSNNVQPNIVCSLGSGSCQNRIAEADEYNCKYYHALPLFQEASLKDHKDGTLYI